MPTMPITMTPQETELCMKSAVDAADTGANFKHIAEALEVGNAGLIVLGADRKATAMMILGAAIITGRSYNDILAAFALEG